MYGKLGHIYNDSFLKNKEEKMKITKRQLRKIILKESGLISELAAGNSPEVLGEEDQIPAKGSAVPYEDAMSINSGVRNYLMGLIKSGLQLQIRKKNLASVSGVTRVRMYVADPQNGQIFLDPTPQHASEKYEGFGQDIDREELEKHVNNRFKMEKAKERFRSVSSAPNSDAGLIQPPGKTFRFTVQWADMGENS